MKSIRILVLGLLVLKIFTQRMWPPTTLIHNCDIDKNYNTIYICWSVKEITRQCLLGMLNDFCEVLRTKLDITRQKIPWKNVPGNAIAVSAMQSIQNIFKNSAFGRYSFIHHVKNYMYFAFLIIALIFISTWEELFQETKKQLHSVIEKYKPAISWAPQRALLACSVPSAPTTLEY